MPCPNYDTLQTDAERRQVDEAVNAFGEKLDELFGPIPVSGAIRGQASVIVCEMRELYACKLKAGRMVFELEQISHRSSERIGKSQGWRRRDIAARAVAYADLQLRINAHGIKLLSWSR